MTDFANTFGGAPLSLQQKTAMDDRLGTALVPTSQNPYSSAMQAPRGGPANPYGPSANGALFSSQNPYSNAQAGQALQAGAYGSRGPQFGIQTPQGNGHGGTMFGSPTQAGANPYANPPASGSRLPKPPPLTDKDGNPLYGSYIPAAMPNFNTPQGPPDPNAPPAVRGMPIANPSPYAPTGTSYAAPGRGTGSMSPEQQAAFLAAQRAAIDANPQGKGASHF